MRKKNIIRFLGVFVIVLFIGIVSVFDVVKAKENSSDNIEVGSYVWFGNYYYRNKVDKEPIKWRVIKVDNDGYYLLADKLIAQRAYWSSLTNVKCWSYSDIRKWLNSDFCDDAFQMEKDDLIKTTISNRELKDPTSTGEFIGSSNYEIVTTDDYVWLLDEEEVQNSSFGFNSDYDRRAQYTPVLSKNEENGRWYLRGHQYIYYGNNYVRTVGPDGIIKMSNTSVQDATNAPGSKYGIRPVIHVKKDSEYLFKTNPMVKGLETAKKYSFTGKKYEKKTGEGDVFIELDENDFSISSFAYNHNLAQYAIAMSTIMYNQVKKNSSDDRGKNNIEEALKGLGYDEESFQEQLLYGDDYDGSFSPYVMASKTINLNNEKTSIVSIFIRGTYQQEWINNFNIGKVNVHQGFNNSASKLKNELYKYIRNNNLDDNNLKIFVTGHSRGAAVANVLGSMINNDITASSNIYVYTFATPNTTKVAKSKRESTNYQNIFNIVNPEDFVTKVVPSKWGYGRYGITYVLPSSTAKNDKEYLRYVEYIRNTYAAMCPEECLSGDIVKTYNPYPNGVNEVSKYVDAMTKKVSLDEYDSKDLSEFNIADKFIEKKGPNTLHDLFVKVLAYTCCKKYETQGLHYAVIALDGVRWGSLGSRTSWYFVNNHAISPYFDWAHRSETYYGALVDNISEEYLTRPKFEVKGIVNCPVDVTIKDKEGNIVGEIKNNEIIDTSDNSIHMDVEGDSKTFYLMDDTTYSIELVGNDSGNMDYTLANVDLDSGEVERTFYQSIPIKKDSTSVQNVSIDEGSIDIGGLESENEIIEPTSIINGQNLGGISVDVDIEGIGAAESYTNVSPGDYIVLQATTDENNDFIGWYQDDILLSADDSLGFSVTSNKKIVAKFTNNIVDINDYDFKYSDLSVEVGDLIDNQVSFSPENATYKDLIYTSSDENVVGVNEVGDLVAKQKGIAKITAVSNNEIEKNFYVTVGSILNVGETVRVPVEKAYNNCFAYACFIPPQDIGYNFNSDADRVSVININGSVININSIKKGEPYYIKFTLDKNYNEEYLDVTVTEKIIRNVIIDKEKSKTIFNNVTDIKKNDFSFVETFEDDSKKEILDFDLALEKEDDTQYGSAKVILSSVVNDVEYKDSIRISIVPETTLNDGKISLNDLQTIYDASEGEEQIFIKFIPEKTGYYQIFGPVESYGINVVNDKNERPNYDYERHNNWYCCRLSAGSDSEQKIYYIKIDPYYYNENEIINDDELCVEYVECTDVEFVEKSASIGVGETKQMTITIEPEDSNAYRYYYVDYDSEDIISVDETGAVTGLKQGTAKVYVRTSTGISDSCDITVFSNGTNLPDNGGNNTNPNPPANGGNNTVTPVNPTGQQTTIEAPVVTAKQPSKTSIKYLKNKSKKSFVANWKNVKASGYEVQFALNKKFTKSKKLKKTTKTSIAIKSLKKGKTYYVRVRAYNKSGNDIKYSKWSSVKKVKIKK